jgi:nucleoside-diphosphate-sugar epimerase
MSKGGEIKMRTNGKESRQFLHADDASECLHRLSRKYHLIPRDENLHVTSFEWSTVKDVANIISDLSKCSIIAADRGDQTQMNAMSKPDGSILKYWIPRISLKDGISKIYDLYQ